MYVNIYDGETMEPIGENVFLRDAIPAERRFIEAQEELLKSGRCWVRGGWIGVGTDSLVYLSRIS